ncbi:MAG: hypothetical protein ACYC1S_11340 [Gemmatimonadaceae bacterium]
MTLVIEPAERKLLRIDPQRSVPGTVIEDRTDGSIDATSVEVLPGGDSLVTHFRTLAELQKVVPVRGNGLATAGYVASPGDTTFLWEVAILGVCDMGDCGQSNEFEWKAYFKVNDADESNRKLYLNLPSDFEGRLDAYLINRRPRVSTERLEVGVVESDYGADDEFGTIRLYSTSFTAIGGSQTPMYSQGDPRCGYVDNLGRTWTCFGTMFWTEVNSSFRRTLNF